MLKWMVTEKFRDYLLGLQFQVYTDNNLLTYIMEVSWEHHKSGGLVSWHCSILSSSTKQADPTGPQMH